MNLFAFFILACALPAWAAGQSRIVNSDNSVSYRYYDGLTVSEKDYRESIRIAELAINQYSKSFPEISRKLLKDALALDANNILVLAYAGASNYESEQFRAALSNFQKCTRINPDSAAYWWQLGLCENAIAFNSDSIEHARQALKSLKKAVALAPRDDRYLGSRACSYMMQGEGKAAVNDLKSAAKLNPGEPHYWYMLSKIYERDESYADAKKALARCVRIKPSEPLFWLNSSQIKLNVDNDYPAAVRDLDSAVLYSPNCAACYFYRASILSGAPVYNQVGAVKDYYRVMRLAESLDPDPQDANKGIYDYVQRSYYQEISREDLNLFSNMYIFNHIIPLYSVHLVTVDISNYASADLFNPLEFTASDIRKFTQIFAMQDLIKTHESLSNTQATKANILKKLNAVSRRGFIFEDPITGVIDSKNSGMGIFYFAGHGLTVNGKAGICPFDYTQGSDAIAVDTILNLLGNSAMGTKDGAIVLCIIEACKNPNSGEASRPDQKLKEQLPENNNLTVIYATEPGKPALGDENGGYLNQAIHEGLSNGKADQNKDTYVTVDEFFQYVQGYVSKKTSGKQVPQISSHPSQKNRIIFQVSN